MDQFESQIARQTDKEWSHKPPTAQCAIQYNEMKNCMNRRKILQKLVDKQPEKTSIVSDIARTQAFYQSKTSINSRRTSYNPESEFNITERDIENTAKRLDENSMLSDPQKLRQYLRGAEAEEIQNCPTRHLFKSSAYQRQLKQAENVEQEPKMSLKQRLQKALGITLGVKQLTRIQDLLKKENGMKIIIDALKAIRISATQAVEGICDGKLQQTRLMMFRQKYEQEHEEKEHLALVQMVEEHCENFFNQQHMNLGQLELFQKFSSSFQSKFQDLVSADTVFRQSNNGSPQSNKSREQNNNSILRNLSNKQRVQESLRQKMVKTVKSRIKKTSGINVHLNTDIFSQFINKREQAMSIQNQANVLVDKLFFNQMGKQYIQRPNSQTDVYQGDHRLSFLQKCQEQKEPILDLMNKIQDKQLILVNYHLNPGQCEGLMYALAAEPELLKTLIIDNCGLTDDMTSHIIQGLVSQKNMNHLYLKNTQIGVKSAQAISLLLQKQIPQNLDDLKLEKCEIKASAMSILLQLPSGISHLQKLTLVDLSFNEEHIELLSQFLQKAKYLVKLDLSWNKFKLQNFLKLFQLICENRKLKDLSLAWNSLVEFNNLGVVGSYCDQESELKERKTYKKHKPPEIIKSKKTKNAAVLLLGEEENKNKIEFNAIEEIVVKGLQKLISQNTKLMHLDLSDTGLSEDMILEIVKAVNYSANLISLHLSGNPGLTIQVESKIFEILNVTFEKSHKLNSFFTHLNKTESPPAKTIQKKLIEGVLLKNIKAQKQQFQPNDVSQLNNVQRRHLILTRKLGHKIDIPGGYLWQAFTNNSDECFVCDRKVYSVFLWTPEVGIIADEELNLTEKQRNQISRYFLLNRETNLKRQDEVRKTGNFINLNIKEEPKFNPNTNKYQNADDSDRSQSLGSRKSSDDDLQRLTPISKTPALHNILAKLTNMKETQQLVHDKHQREIMIDNKININGQEAPLLYGPFNNWQPQPMINVSLLAQYILDDPRPDFFQQMVDDGYCRTEVKTLNDLNRGERKYYDNLVQEFYKRYEQFSVWSKALSSFIPYKSPHIYGIDYLQTVDAKKIFFSANFIGCGKQHFAVQYDNQIYLHRTIADFRREEVIIPPLDAKEINRIERNPNVFKNYVLDSHAIHENCMRSDFEGWKLARFVKDPTEQNEIRQIFRKEYSYLKDLQLTLTAHSNFPGLTMPDFDTFIESLEIIGGPLTIGIVETQFIAARTDAENRGMKIHGQSPQDINRFEFFEALVRVSGAKYKQQGLASNYAESLKKLIERIKEMFEFDTQQSFRDQLLYTREVNLTLDANKEGLMEVYNMYINKKTQRVSFKRCMQLLTTDTNIKLSEKQAIICYAMCQMTCPDLVKNAYLCVNHITFVEFLELVGRVAFMHLEEMDEPLEVKINFILDEWLALVGYERLESVYFEEGVFEGDNDLQTKGDQLLRLRLSKKFSSQPFN